MVQIVTACLEANREMSSDNYNNNDKKNNGNDNNSNNEDKWMDFLTERKFGLILKKVPTQSLDDIWACLVEILSTETRTTTTTTTKVHLLLKLLIVKCVEDSEHLLMYVQLIEKVFGQFSAQFKVQLPLICEELRRTYIDFSLSGDSYMSQKGRNFCRVLSYLLTKPRKNNCILFKIVLSVVKDYVEIWTYPENIEVVDELHGYRLCVEASAVTFLVEDLVSCVEQDDILLKVEIDRFLLLIWKTLENDLVSKEMKDIYGKVTPLPLQKIATTSSSESVSTISTTSHSPIGSTLNTTLTTSSATTMSAMTTRMLSTSGSRKGADVVVRQGSKRKLKLPQGRGHGMVHLPAERRGQGLCGIPGCRSYSVDFRGRLFTEDSSFSSIYHVSWLGKGRGRSASLQV